MSFYPQYGLWSRDDFNSSSGSTTDSPGEYEIRDGVIKLIPQNLTAGTHYYNAPWDSPPSWHVENSLDSISKLSEDFIIFTGGGDVSQYGHIGNTYNTAYFTSGDQSCFIYLISGGGPLPQNMTIDLDVRTLYDNNYTGGLFETGNAYHGIVLQDNSLYAFIEMHPDGIKLYGQSGICLPGNYHDGLRKIRVVKESSNISIMSYYEESTLYAYSGFKAAVFDGALPVGQKSYIAFGSVPWYNGAFFTGGGREGHFYDMANGQIRPEFHGMTLWDDIKINTGLALTSHPNNYIPEYPLGTKNLYTDAWYPSYDIKRYQGAFVETVGTTGGVLQIKAQYLKQTDDSLIGTWTNVPNSVQQTIIPRDENSYTWYYDLSKLPVYHAPFRNGLRFKFTAFSNGGQVPIVDAVTFVAVGGSNEGKVKPNWKLNSFAKELYFSPDIAKHEQLIPPAHPQDICYLHNEGKLAYVTHTGSIPAAIEGVSLAGKVISRFDTLTGNNLGLTKIEDGIYGSAWRNFNKVKDYVGNWTSQSTYFIDYSGTFKGEALDIFSPYPSYGLSVSGASEVICSIYEYLDFNRDRVKAQKVVVKNYNDDVITDGNTSQIAGICLTGIYLPLNNDKQIGVVEGHIHIPRGPGVTVSFQDEASTHTYLLRGDEYRTPRKFACGCIYTGDYSTNNSRTTVAFGVLPRESTIPILDYSEYGEWGAKLKYHEDDEFILYNLTGYITDHSWVSYSGFSNKTRRVNFGIGGVKPFIANNTGVAGNLGTLGDFDAVNTFLAANGAIDKYYAPTRNSLVMEGWFRPYGILTSGSSTTEVPLLEAIDSNGLGSTIYLNTDGRLRHYTTVAYSDCGTGSLGSGMYGPTSYQSNSKTDAVAWGNWNHVALIMEQSSLGDGEHRSAYASTPKEFSSYYTSHGARISKIYLKLNDKIVAQSEIAGNSYIAPKVAAGAVDSIANYPPIDMALDTFPKLARLYITSKLDVKIGEHVLCDYDHIRVGIRDRADILTDGYTLGSKSLPGLFPHKNMPKPFLPTASGVGHWQMAHVFPFDTPLEDYCMFDWGHSTAHGLIRGQASLTSTSELHYYGVGEDFFLSRSKGPDGRDCLRIGPGSRIDIPWNSLDERIFNGTGSFDLASNQILPRNGGYYNYVTTAGYAHQRTTSNSAIQVGGWFKLNKIPTTGYMDLWTLDEDPSYSAYGRHQIYMSVDQDGYHVVGSRWNYASDFGPFTGSLLTTGVWYHLGMEAALRENHFYNPADDAYFKMYFNGNQVREITCVAITAGGAQKNQGHPFGWGGRNDAGGNLSLMRIGGDMPRGGTPDSWTYRYGDFDIQDFVVGFPLQVNSGEETLQWNWSELGQLGPKGGNSEVFVVNGNKLGYITGDHFTGSSVYGATSIEDAGTQYMFFTMNGGNDYEGLLGRGMQLSPLSPFTNAESYYAIYENDSNTDIIGSTDSPIQIANNVPLEGVNLALVNISPWSTNNSISTFDMADNNYANITAKINGDKFINVDSGSADYQFSAQKSIETRDILLSSIAVYNTEIGLSTVGYYTHLLGQGSKGVYIPSAESHISASTNIDLWFKNLDKIYNAISVTDINGNKVDFEVFPYSLYSSPFKPQDSVPDTQELAGIGSITTGNTLNAGTFSVCLVASRQTIGDTVFINYPSIDYDNGNINFNDIEAYNPVPVMLRLDKPHKYIPNLYTGSFSVVNAESENVYDVAVWNLNYTGFYNNNQSLL